MTTHDHTTNHISVSTRSACSEACTGIQSMSSATATVAPPITMVRISSGTVWRDLSTAANYQLIWRRSGVPRGV